MSQEPRIKQNKSSMFYSMNPSIVRHSIETESDLRSRNDDIESVTN